MSMFEGWSGRGCVHTKLWKNDLSLCIICDYEGDASKFARNFSLQLQS